MPLDAPREQHTHPDMTDVEIQNKRLLPPKKIKFTKKEPTAIPARVFPNFPKLAREL